MTDFGEKLVEFYGDGCSHCEEMRPKVEKLEEELDIKVQRLEVWNSDKNKEKYFEIDGDDKCGGVPFFYNTETEESICGSTSYENLESWAKGEQEVKN